MARRVACVLGSGNSAHVLAGLIASSPGWACRLFDPWQDRAERVAAGVARGGIRVQYGAADGHRELRGRPQAVSKHAAEVVPGCELLVMCLPALAYDLYMQAIAPHLDRGAMIGTICGSNGFDCQRRVAAGALWAVGGG